MKTGRHKNLIVAFSEDGKPRYKFADVFAHSSEDRQAFGTDAEYGYEVEVYEEGIDTWGDCEWMDEWHSFVVKSLVPSATAIKEEEENRKILAVGLLWFFCRGGEL